ncbi:MAG: methyltransferase domain-containing protein [Candidatus Omnitrophica bacterium]|nr:methyltransferase domain-containing protein [Candidatus Omnitrophota bacterium]
MMLEHMVENLDIFICPACRGDLEIKDEHIACLKCHNTYRIEDGIPLLFLTPKDNSIEKDVTNMVKSFYERTPFPDYDDLENVEHLIEKARRSVFMHLLNEQIPFNIRVLEVGCGTGQLTNFLSTASRVVFGTDTCLNSLKLAQEFKEKNNLKRAGFYQMNLFSPIFKDESFPLVICNGVLHHTSDPFVGFQSIARLVKRGGYIIIGLYNKYGRIMTDIRRVIFKVLGERFMFLDPRLRRDDISDARKHTWFLDQYKNPYESKHTIGEVLRWFDSSSFTFINSVPKSKVFHSFSEDEALFSQNPRGNWFDHFLVQTKLMFSGSREGGLFLMIGMKK